MLHGVRSQRPVAGRGLRIVSVRDASAVADSAENGMFEFGAYVVFHQVHS